MKKNNKMVLENHDTIYDVDNWTVFKKNFLAGLSRSAGGWFFNIVILAILAYVLIPVFGSMVQRITDAIPKNLNETIIKIEKTNN